MIEDKDLCTGSKLICVNGCEQYGYKHTTGMVYEVLEPMVGSRWPYCIECDDNRSFFYNLSELNYGVTCPSFVPLVGELSSKELFLYELSGKLPERFDV